MLVTLVILVSQVTLVTQVTLATLVTQFTLISLVTLVTKVTQVTKSWDFKLFFGSVPRDYGKLYLTIFWFLENSWDPIMYRNMLLNIL